MDGFTVRTGVIQVSKGAEFVRISGAADTPWQYFGGPDHMLETWESPTWWVSVVPLTVLVAVV